MESLKIFMRFLAKRASIDWERGDPLPLNSLMEVTMSVILAQDPSFSSLGFSLYDGDRTIYVDKCNSKFENKIGFEDVYYAGCNIFEAYCDKLEGYGIGKNLKLDYIISEVPPPVGVFSAGLYALNTLLFYRLFDTYRDCKGIYILPPSFLMTVHNKKNYKKSESTILANYLIDSVLGDRFTVKYSGRLNADMAESFIFLMRAFCRFDERGLRSDIIGALPGLYSESEKLLVGRSKDGKESKAEKRNTKKVKAVTS